MIDARADRVSTNRNLYARTHAHERQQKCQLTGCEHKGKPLILAHEKRNEGKAEKKRGNKPKE